jgi:hypothetical protein
MTLPREVVPGRFYMFTRRCTQRMFLLRPDDETNQLFLYCLGVAVQRFEVDLILPCAMSNHHHTAAYDRLGNYPEFLEYFHKLVARGQNALRGRSENLWSTEQPSVVRLLDREDVIRKLVYIATNPVNDDLVAKVHHWPGVNGLSALLRGQVLRVKRPRHFFSANGSMPDEVELRMRIPSELGDENDILREVERRVRQVETDMAVERMRTGRRVLGRRRVLAQSWRSCPATWEPRRELQPRLAAVHTWSRVEALLRDREWQRAYRAAREAWSAGLPAVFPPGTYWLRRFAQVPLSAN